jgi:hypothetical protein
LSLLLSYSIVSIFDGEGIGFLGSGKLEANMAKNEEKKIIGNSGKAGESKIKFTTKEPGFAPQPRV